MSPEIKATDVKALRERTGAAMMDCKSALTEADGDIDKAIELLRVKGQASAAKRSGRSTSEGIVASYVHATGRIGSLVEIQCETDFVARNDGFQAFVREAAKIGLMGNGTIESLEAAHFPGSQTTVKDRLQELIATIGENMTLRRIAKLEVSKGVIASYVHNAVTEGLGKIGVLVALESEGDVTVLGTLGRQIAMHVAATNPVALDASGVDQATVERESAILRDKNAGKPDHVMQKIIESGLKSYFKEVTLLEQPFVHDPSKTVTQVLKEAESKAGKPVTLKAFVRYALGEGIEKEEAPDFAAEVAAQAGLKKA